MIILITVFQRPNIDNCGFYPKMTLKYSRTFTVSTRVLFESYVVGWSWFLSPSRRARVLILLGDLLLPGILTSIAESIDQSSINSMSWTLDVQWSWLLCASARFERVKTGNQQLPDWLRQKVSISIRNVNNLTVILLTIFLKCFVNFNQNKR